MRMMLPLNGQLLIMKTKTHMNIGMGAKRNNQMLKTIALSVMVATATATAVVADTVDRIKVYDHTTTVVTQIPTTETRCSRVQVPIYEDVQRKGDAAGGALAGMIIGGILGKGVTGKDDGAAAGAVIGGLIGADKGGQTKTERRVVGYQNQDRCEDVVVYVDQREERYSHSTIRFYLNGKRYVVEFIR